MSKSLLVTPSQTEGLQMVPELDGNTVLVRLKGNADSGANGAFGQFLTSVHGEVSRLGVSSVKVDLTELYFMTSSCIKCFVTWIALIKELPRPKQYKLEFVVNPALRWQRRNVDVLLQLSDMLTLTERKA